MTIVKHAAFSTEVSKREVFWPPDFLICQHSQLFLTFFTHWNTVFFSLKFRTRDTSIKKKKYWVPARNTQQVEGKKLICTHILTWFQRVACVSKVRIPALNASLSSNPSDPKNVHFYCILAWMPRKSANTSIVLSIFSHTLLPCSSIFCVHFHCAPVLFACISLGFLDREYLMFWEAFWIALGCFWGA